MGEQLADHLLSGGLAVLGGLSALLGSIECLVQGFQLGGGHCGRGPGLIALVAHLLQGLAVGGAMEAIWMATDNGYMKALDKYDLALRLAGKEPFDSAAQPRQNAGRLIKLRNTLAHYRPATIYADTVHSEGKHLHGAFKPNALMSNSDLWFPDRVLGAGCADWAWRSARAFTDEFSRRIGMDLNYQLADHSDPLPK